MATASAGTFLVMTEPAPTIAPSPTVTGATRAESRPDERAGTNLGRALGEAVIVAGDGACADVGPCPHGGIAEVGQVVGLRSGAQPGLLHLNKVPDARPLTHERIRPQPSVGTNGRAALHGRRLERREAVNRHVLPHRGVDELTVCANTRTRRERRLSTENDPGSERHIGGDLNLRLNHHRADVLKVDPVPCVLLDHTLLQNLPGQCQLVAIIDALDFAEVAVNLHTAPSLTGRPLHDVGEVDLILVRMWLKRGENRAKPRDVEAVQARVDLADGQLRSGRFLGLDDAPGLTRCVSLQPTVVGAVFEPVR